MSSNRLAPNKKILKNGNFKLKLRYKNCVLFLFSFVHLILQFVPSSLRRCSALLRKFKIINFCP